MGFVSDDFRAWAMAKRLSGVGVCGAPFEMEKILDYFGPKGSGSNVYLSFIYQLPKWAFTVKKVDEFLNVTPEWVELYNITIAQRQKLEQAIKTGLTSAAQAVADYELLAHDARRYREMLDYFKIGQKDEHILRSLFVDRVDAYTGEGYSIVTMARRWPTIISDFIRMKSEWSDPEKIPDTKDQINKIKTELDVSVAEATVLKTKNELFREWKRVFFPVVKERYGRIENMVRSRKKSVDEYKNWLKPYIAQFKMMRDALENPTDDLTNPYMTPGFLQSEAFSGVRLWVWKPFSPAEMGKPELMPEAKERGFMTDPYDALVKEWQKKIEDQYEVKFTEDDINDILKKATTGSLAHLGLPPDMSRTTLYYIFFDIQFLLSLVKTPPPAGFEGDDLMVWPIKTWIMSQNSLLIHILELRAREIQFERYVNQIIGASNLEEDIIKKVEEEFKEKPPEEPKRFTPVRNFVNNVNTAGGKINPYLDKFAHIFVKRGPYESNFEERLTKMFFRGAGAFYKQLLDKLEGAMQIE